MNDPLFSLPQSIGGLLQETLPLLHLGIFIITFASQFMMGKAHKLRTFPKYGAKYNLILDHLS
jgi:hypothetical protein